MSVYCALVHPDDIRAALLLAVNHSGDSDSTGAITGNLMGIANALPAFWVQALEGLATMETLAAGFAVAFAPDHQPDAAWLTRYPPA
jgi:ADP-ribosylglycohydrolase